MKKKGSTLVEVLVSLVIVSIIFASCLTTYLLTIKAQSKQKEYLHFETICQDIDKYSDRYKKDWNIYYFDNTNNKQYYDNNFNLVDTNQEYKYELSFYYTNANELIVDVYNIDGNYKIIDTLNYGSYRYA